MGQWPQRSPDFPPGDIFLQKHIKKCACQTPATDTASTDTRDTIRQHVTTKHIWAYSGVAITMAALTEIIN